MLDEPAHSTYRLVGQLKGRPGHEERAFPVQLLGGGDVLGQLLLVSRCTSGKDWKRVVMNTIWNAGTPSTWIVAEALAISGPACWSQCCGRAKEGGRRSKC